MLGLGSRGIQMLVVIVAQKEYLDVNRVAHKSK